MRFSIRPLWLGALLLAILILMTGAEKSTADDWLVTGRELVFSGAQFSSGLHEGTRATDKGLTLSAEEGIYYSAMIPAPISFTDVGALWILERPAGAEARLEVRTSADGDGWTPWKAVEAEEDLKRLGDKDTMGSLTTVPKADRVHRYVQYRWHLVASPAGDRPILKRLRLAFIDASRAPEFSTADGELDGEYSLTAFPKPAVVSRTAWGCPDGQGSPDWPPEYYPVSHVIVHHTVSDTSVLSIWYYHAITRGWGDIGYNYLVDKNGVLYEGRAGGDDVVAGHAYPFNVGSLGVSFIGYYVDVPAPQPMIESMSDLLAWKADQKGIPPEGWAWLRPQNYPDNPDLWLPRFSGHRDVSQTECPGDQLYAQIPELRQKVAIRLDGLGYQLADELNTAVFEKSNANWYDSPSSCGYDGHAYWTFSATDPSLSTNWGRWRPNLSESGAYRVYAYVPYCLNGYPDSSGVTYRVHHAQGDTYISVNQAAAAGGWAELGVFSFSAGTDGYVFLSDLAVDSNRSVWFDAVRWLREDEHDVTLPPSNLAPANASWSANRTVAFRWSASPSDNIDYYRFRIAADPGFTTLITDQNVDYANQDFYYTFGTDYQKVYWGVQAHGPNGYSVMSGPWTLGVDSVAPTSAVEYVITYPDGRYTIHWRGSDSTSGIASYDIEYRVGSLPNWTRWLTQTPSQGAEFPYPITEATYFRSRATDRAGNVGLWDNGTMGTNQAILLDRSVWITLAMN